MLTLDHSHLLYNCMNGSTKWWERGIEQSKKMVISYDNLITRLWLSGAIMPYEKGGYASSVSLLDDIGATTTSSTPLDPIDSNGEIDTLINDRGLPPVPHQFWVDRLGFQQGSFFVILYLTLHSVLVSMFG